MRRNKKMIRDILLKLHNGENIITVENKEELYHLDLMYQAGWISSDGYSKYYNSEIRKYHNLRLTWYGAEVADILSPEDNWTTIEQSNLINLPFDIIIEIHYRRMNFN